MNKYISILIGIVISSFLILIFCNVAERYEVYECYLWANQSIEFENWYATDWQTEQCNNFGIKLNK